MQRLLAFARRQPLQATDIDVAALVRGMAALIESSSSPRIRLVLDLPDGLLPAVADANQLEMAILNLAVKNRLYAARNFDVVIFRRWNLRHHLDMDVQRYRSGAIYLNFFVIIEM